MYKLHHTPYTVHDHLHTFQTYLFKANPQTRIGTQQLRISVCFLDAHGTRHTCLYSPSSATRKEQCWVRVMVNTASGKERLSATGGAHAHVPAASPGCEGLCDRCCSQISSATPPLALPRH